MAEPKARATDIEYLFPWLLHWTIADERIGGFRSDAFALRTPEGLMVIDPVPLTDRLQAELQNVGAIFLTHANHQRSAWRFRKELGAPVYAPTPSLDLDEEPDFRYNATTPLPGGLQAVPASGFRDACYLVFKHAEGTGVLFCGDLICHDPDGPYRFPLEPGYFDLEGGREDTRHLLDQALDAMCAAHAVPSLDGCREALQGALSRST